MAQNVFKAYFSFARCAAQQKGYRRIWPGQRKTAGEKRRANKKFTKFKKNSWRDSETPAAAAAGKWAG